MTDLVPQAVRDLLAFYTERHPEVRFGDLDVSVLKRAVESIDEAAKNFISAEEAVAQAREQFHTAEVELSVKAGRTLSFLKIFVDSDKEQLAKLEAIGGAMPIARRKPKASADAASGADEPRQRRTRKSKNSVEATSETPANADSTVEAAHEKVGLSDHEPAATPKPAKKKTGSKSDASE